MSMHSLVWVGSACGAIFGTISMAFGQDACVIDLTCATLTEPEACGADLNGGCNIGPDIANFTVVTSGDIVSGKAYADAGTRDTDWYRIDLTLPAHAALDVNADGLLRICVNVVSELPIVSFFIQDELQDCLGGFSFPGGTSFSQTCAPEFGNDSLELALDTYYIFAGTGTPGGGALFDGFPCDGAFGDNYMLSIDVLDNDGTVCPNADAVSCVTACPWDLDGDGNVLVPDLLLLLGDFGSCDGSPADFDGNGCVGVPDLLALLFNFGPCDAAIECLSDAGCDDENPCTIDLCIRGHCFHVPLGPGCDGG